jgi:uncharacterized cupin superfamily protein
VEHVAAGSTVTAVRIGPLEAVAAVSTVTFQAITATAVAAVAVATTPGQGDTSAETEALYKFPSPKAVRTAVWHCFTWSLVKDEYIHFH